jgi:hypothetical protein
MRDTRDWTSTVHRMLALAALVLAAPAHAETFSVSCNAAELADTLAIVNANGQEDFVWLRRNCSYLLAASLVVQADGGNPVRIHAQRATLSGQDARVPLVVEAGATLHLFDATVRDGLASGSGGGIRNAGTLVLNGSTVTENAAPQGYGGAIYNTGAASVVRSTIAGNSSAVQAGGIDNHNGRLALFESTVSGNTSLYGGGVRNGGRAALFNSTLFENASFIGGGILNDPAGRLFLTNVTISNNAISGSNGGGGIRNEGDLQMDNSIIANHPSVYADCSNTGTITAYASNLIEDGSCALLGSFAADPKLGAPTGSPEMLPLLAGSPAIDAGQNPSCMDVDQRGAQRPHDGNKDGFVICDLGAHELKPKGSCGLLGIEALALLPFARRVSRRRVP